jgi:hypothetical protein
VDSGRHDIGWRAQRTAIVTPDAVLSQDVPPPQPGPTRKQRRLSDHILIAFHFACDQGELEVADLLLGIRERMVLRPSLPGHAERRTDISPLVAALERLWDLRHSEARDH